MIVQAAKMNGIKTANEMPNTATRTSSAIGSAIDSPFLRSLEKIGSRSCWIAACPVTYTVVPGVSRSFSRIGVV